MFQPEKWIEAKSVKMKKRIVIIANFCDYAQEKTNNRFNYLSELFASAGFEVELITSTFSHYINSRTGLQKKCVVETIQESLCFW